MSRNISSCGNCLRRAVVTALPARSTAAGALPTLTQRQYSSEPASAPGDAPRTLDLEVEDPAAAETKAKAKFNRVVKNQLQHMSDDPYAIAHYVEKALDRGAFEEAITVTRKLTSQGKQLIVAWNHLIDYQLKNQNVKEALKIFNDMKKRAQFPSVRTYTILFRGLANSKHPKHAVAEAVKHYNVLLNDKRIEPNSTHLNAVLNVCAKAGDMDNLFLIAQSVNNNTRSPTAYTYATILHALRHHATDGVADLTEEQRITNQQSTIDRAQKLWVEIIRKWKDAKLIIDEELVCSMGRLLIMSPNIEEKRRVFQLLEQTMNIPNLIENPELGAERDENMKDIARSAPLTVPNSPKTTYAVPGRNTMSLIMAALASTREITSGIKYWNLLVSHYGVLPDRDNWLRMFGMLKVSKSSAYASAILDIVPAEYIDGKHFKIAMETCVRDSLNRNAVKNATTVLDTMLRRMKEPDLMTLRLYLRVALVTHKQIRAQAAAGDLDAAKRVYGEQITLALSKLWEPYRQAHYHHFELVKPMSEVSKRINYNNQREVIALARAMVSAFDKVLHEQMLSETDLKEIKHTAAHINRQIKDFYSTPIQRQKDREDEADDNSPAPQQEEGEHMFKGKEWVWDTYTSPTKPERPQREKPERTTNSREGQAPRKPREQLNHRNSNSRSGSSGGLGSKARARYSREAQMDQKKDSLQRRDRRLVEE
ncbi:uncharacterized protein F5Z01DRAFT_680810 [Emericellopsis atlantica]|uniref:Pentatricopeptide repeat protein n=1 Tax=Emericellopsis atlantica TaxID=2614577 RepID=A0A9P8CQ24_9HYPO|nr:uncharacterized protein F5Z01DRAFT_680810 [Emericellopsis atlantica]KAG9255178.1 hypothetical protein F5Z01DRAFT_680810 [Emericellopsis atlantica]